MRVRARVQGRSVLIASCAGVSVSLSFCVLYIITASAFCQTGPFPFSCNLGRSSQTSVLAFRSITGTVRIQTLGMGGSLGAVSEKKSLPSGARLRLRPIKVPTRLSSNIAPRAMSHRGKTPMWDLRTKSPEADDLLIILQTCT